MAKPDRQTVENDLRALVRRAWDADLVQLAIELEATAFRCLDIDLNAERKAVLDASAERRRIAWKLDGREPR